MSSRPTGGVRWPPRSPPPRGGPGEPTPIHRPGAGRCRPPGPARIEPELSPQPCRSSSPPRAPRRPAPSSAPKSPRRRNSTDPEPAGRCAATNSWVAVAASGTGPVHSRGDLPAQRLVITVVIDLAGQLHRDQLTQCAHRRGDLAVLRTLGDPQLGELGPAGRPHRTATAGTGRTPRRTAPGAHWFASRPPSRPRPPSPGHRQSGETIPGATIPWGPVVSGRDRSPAGRATRRCGGPGIRRCAWATSARAHARRVRPRLRDPVRPSTAAVDTNPGDLPTTVVDKETGEVTAWPRVPAAVVAADVPTAAVPPAPQAGDRRPRPACCCARSVGCRHPPPWRT